MRVSTEEGRDGAAEESGRGFDVSILIVSFNTREVLQECLRSIFAQTTGISFEIIIVDNASADRSAEAVQEKFPGVVVIRQPFNCGFGAATNLGAGVARGEYLLLLNPDTVVLDGGVQKALAFARSRPDAGVVGGRTLYADRSLNPTSCFAQPSLWGSFCQGAGLSILGRNVRVLNPDEIGGWQRDTVREVGVITGCFFLIRRDLWTRLGGFDERFFMYSEDTDLSLRVQQAGFKCIHFPGATIIHHGGRADSLRAEKITKVFRARLQFFRKHWSRPAAAFGLVMLELGVLVRIAAHKSWRTLGSRRANPATWRAVWAARAFWRADAQQLGIPMSRGDEIGRQATRDVSDG
jgi:GT2 family glycosyltransferase